MSNYHLYAAIASVANSPQTILLEALASPSHKAMATKAANDSKDSTGLTAAERISKSVMPTDRVQIPLERPEAKPHPFVQTHLKNHGYSISGDYSEGLAAHESNPNRKMKIGKVLEATGATESIKKVYAKDPARQGVKSNASIVISRRPHDVAAMSTHQNWESCQTLGGKAKVGDETHVQEKGSRSEDVPGIVSSGAHMAYLVHHADDVDKHYKPVARVTLNSYKSTSSDHTILRPSVEYGDHWDGFHSTVKNWSDKQFPAKDPEYVRHQGAYPEGDSVIRNFAPEHNEYWKKSFYDPYVQEHHPEKEVIDHLVKHATIGNNYGIAHLFKNKHLSPEHVTKLVDHVSSMPDDRERGPLRGVAAATVKDPEQIHKLLVKNPGSSNIAGGVAKNPHATAEQLHTVLDTHGAGETSKPGVRTLSGYKSSELIDNIVKHKNADDSHFHKILQLDEFQHNNILHKTEAVLNHETKLEHIASRYTSPEVGQKLVHIISGIDNKVNPHQIVHDIASKHPHLLPQLPDHDIVNAYGRHPLNRNLENEAIRRNTDTSMKMVANRTYDKTLAQALTTHHNPEIAQTAKDRSRMLDYMEKDKNASALD